MKYGLPGTLKVFMASKGIYPTVERTATLVKGWIYHCRFLSRYAQSEKEGALTELERLKSLMPLPDALEMEYLFDLCNLANQFSLWEMMAGPLDRLEELSRKDGFILGLSQVGYFRAALSVKDGDYRGANDQYLEALEYAHRAGDSNLEAEILNDIGFCYRRLGDYTSAEEYYQRSLEQRKRTDNLTGQAESLGNLGVFYYAKSEHVKAERCLQQAKQISVSIGDRIGLGYVYVNLGYLAYAKGRLQEAELHCRMSIDERQAIGDDLGLGYCHLLLFHLKSIGGHEKEAIDCAEKAHVYFSRVKDINGKVEIELNLARYFLNCDKILEAENHLSKARSISEGHASSEVERATINLQAAISLAKTPSDKTNIDRFRKSPQWRAQDLYTSLTRAEIIGKLGGDRSRAIEECKSQLEKNKRHGNVINCGLTHVAWSKVAECPEEKEKHLKQALAIFEDIKAAFWTNRIKAILSEKQR